MSGNFLRYIFRRVGSCGVIFSAKSWEMLIVQIISRDVLQQPLFHGDYKKKNRRFQKKIPEIFLSTAVIFECCFS
jgi:hypothetical protein